MTGENGSNYDFNFLFIRRFFRLHYILFPGLCSLTSGVFVLLLLTSGLEQFLAYEIGLISGAEILYCGNGIIITLDFLLFQAVNHLLCSVHCCSFIL